MPSQRTPVQGISSQDIPKQHASSWHQTLATSPGQVSVLAFSAGFRLLCMLPLLLAVWVAVAWALAD